MARLGDVFSLIRNGASIKQTDGAQGIPITRIETISLGEVDRNKLGYANIFDIAKYRDFLLKDGDILMSHINSEKHLGKTAIYSVQQDEKLIHGMNLLMLRANSDLIIPKYAFYYFNSPNFLYQIPNITKKSVNQASFTVTALKELTIPILPIAEQQKIVTIFDLISNLINDNKAIIKKLDNIVKSRFIEMFGDPVSNPMRWEESCVREIVTDVRYGTSRPATEGGKYPYLRMNNLTVDGYLDLKDIKYIDIPEDEIDKCMVRKGDVLFNRTNSIDLVGKTCVFDLTEQMVIAGYIIRVRLKDYVLPVFLSCFMNSAAIKKQLRNMAKGAVNQANINAQELQSIKLYLPPLDLQEQFAAFVESTDKLKVEVKQSLEKLETMKKALMQKYFG